MIYVFTLTTDRSFEQGSVGFAELPDLLHRFQAAALGHSATFASVRGGLLIAEREGHYVTLSVCRSEHSIPGRCIFDSIDVAMDSTFGNTFNGESDAL